MVWKGGTHRTPGQGGTSSVGERLAPGRSLVARELQGFAVLMAPSSDSEDELLLFFLK